jgi:hypothetical protein
MRGQDYAKSAMNPQDKALGSYTEAVFSCYIELKIYAMRRRSSYFFTVISVENSRGITKQCSTVKLSSCFFFNFRSQLKHCRQVSAKFSFFSFKTRILLIKMYYIIYTRARNYSPSIRENKFKTLVFSH